MKSVTCPICDKRMDNQGPKELPAWPFCSDRCRLVDLGRWLKQDYAVPIAAPPPAADASKDVDSDHD